MGGQANVAPWGDGPKLWGHPAGVHTVRLLPPLQSWWGPCLWAMLLAAASFWANGPLGQWASSAGAGEPAGVQKQCCHRCAKADEPADGRLTSLLYMLCHRTKPPQRDSLVHGEKTRHLPFYERAVHVVSSLTSIKGFASKTVNCGTKKTKNNRINTVNRYSSPLGDFPRSTCVVSMEQARIAFGK